MSRYTLMHVFVLLPLVGCAEREHDLLSAMRGRCAGTWYVDPAHAERVTDYVPPRERLEIELSDVQPLGEALVPAKAYARGSLAFGNTRCDCLLEFRLRSDGSAGAYVRYVSPTTAPFGLGGDSAGFFVDLVTEGDIRQDWLLVDFRRDGEAASRSEPWLRYLRAP